MKKDISVVIPVYNDSILLEKCLKSLKDQSDKGFEIIVVDDCSTDNSYEIAKNYADKAIKNKENKGPAISRNNAIKLAKNQIIAFTDSDCVVDKDWIKNIRKNIENENVLMGNTKIKKTSYIADSIASLGFPGGAMAGFRTMWPVDKDGYTNHISSCNFAMREKVFEKYGYFDESFPFPGGEDPELAIRVHRKGIKIKYCEDVLIYHEPIRSLSYFVKWQFKRGRTNYHFKKKVGEVGSFVKLRIKSSLTILKNNLFNVKVFMIFFLIVLSFILQQTGYFYEVYRLRK